MGRIVPLVDIASGRGFVGVAVPHGTLVMVLARLIHRIQTTSSGVRKIRPADLQQTKPASNAVCARCRLRQVLPRRRLQRCLHYLHTVQLLHTVRLSTGSVADSHLRTRELPTKNALRLIHLALSGMHGAPPKWISLETTCMGSTVIALAHHLGECAVTVTWRSSSLSTKPTIRKLAWCCRHRHQQSPQPNSRW